MFNSNQAFLLMQKLKSTRRASKKAEIENIFPIYPKLLTNVKLYDLVLALKAKKKILLNLGSQFATLQANVPTFVNILMSMF
jgi:hypothetical protein